MNSHKHGLQAPPFLPSTPNSLQFLIHRQHVVPIENRHQQCTGRLGVALGQKRTEQRPERDLRHEAPQGKQAPEEPVEGGQLQHETHVQACRVLEEEPNRIAPTLPLLGIRKKQHKGQSRGTENSATMGANQGSNQQSAQRLEQASDVLPQGCKSRERPSALLSLCPALDSMEGSEQDDWGLTLRMSPSSWSREKARCQWKPTASGHCTMRAPHRRRRSALARTQHSRPRRRCASQGQHE